MSVEYRVPTADELRGVLETTYAAFGDALKDEDLDRHRRVMPLDRILGAWDGARPVGVTASYPFELTIPGGVAPAAGVTWVGVLPSHRRRGILRELMRRQLDDVHGRGEPLAILWASESAIYGRFGYGISAPLTSLAGDRSHFQLRAGNGADGAVRLVTEEEARTLFPPVYERVRRGRPGMLGRSEDWWTQYRLPDPEHWRRDAGPKFYALLEIEGEAAGYAIYRIASKWDDGTPQGEVRIMEAFATSTAATTELWRFLFGIDLVVRVKSWSFDPTLFLMVTDPRRLHLSLGDGLWLRLVDVDAALQARSYEEGEDVVVEVEDDLLLHNTGRWGIGSDVRKTKAKADIGLHVADLASAYLGAFSFEQLAAAGRVHELRRGALARASTLFRTPLPPYCPEEF